MRVIDADTLQVDGKVVQLYGIDAPELGQLCESGGSLWHQQRCCTSARHSDAGAGLARPASFS